MTVASKILGVDYGSVRIGLAISDVDRKFAFPLDVYERRDAAGDSAYFVDVVAKSEIALLVVGLPVHLSGREGQKAAEARAFGKWLGEVTKLPVIFWDERFSTVEAESALWNAGLTHKQRKARRDKVAAQVMLQAYLDAGCPAEESARALDE